jgi:vacuolar protein sorting-associated protein 52
MFDYLENILLPRELIEYLCEADIEAETKEYLAKVKVLNDMLESANSKNTAQSRALEEVRPELEKLKFKVCSRARNFLIAKLNNLKKPKTNF